MRAALLKTSAVLAVAAVLCGALASCNKPPVTPETPDPVVEPEPEPLGHYSFGGAEHDINYAVFEASDYYHSFMFSPIAGDDNKTELVVFAVRNYWADGQTHDINDSRNPLAHNDDYMFVYEDLDWYYSQYRALQSGSFCITPLSGTVFRIQIDVRLADGTPFLMDFTHDYSE